MNRTRALLLLAAVTSLALGALSLNGKMALFLGLSVSMFLSSLILFVFSFSKVSVGPNGELEYDPDNLYWKFMSKLSLSFKSGSVSICKAFWITTGLTIVLIFLSIIVLAILIGVYKFYLAKGFVALSYRIASITGVTIIGYLLIRGLYILETRKDPVIEAVMGPIAILIVFLAMVVAPIVALMYDADLSLLAAIGFYILGTGGIIVGFATLFFLVYLASRLFSFLSNTVLGQYLINNKEDFCPTLKAQKTQNFSD